MVMMMVVVVMMVMNDDNDLCLRHDWYSEATGEDESEQELLHG
jgi:hypothetical protein